MDKLKMQTANKADENFKKLAAMFPNAVTETIDENGEVVRAIDKDVLMQEISCKVVDGNEERYQFTWPDKKKSVLLANAPINKTLRPCREESVDFDNTENLYIEGDNLEVLKLLQETYLGKIKMIYIDPPYNTGNDFVYEDNFAQSTEEYLENSGLFDDEGNRLVKNLDSNGRFHTDWLNMIYPRLKIAKDLLSDDGVIFISIDDNEATNMKKICDEIFGASNYLETFYLQVRFASKSLNERDDFQKLIEQVFIYTRNKGNFTPSKPFENYDLSKFCWKITEKGIGDDMMLGGKKVTLYKPGEYVIEQVPYSIEGLKETWASGSVLKGNTSGKFFDKQLSHRVSTDGYGCLYKVEGIGEDGIGFRYFTGPKKEGATKGKFYSGVPTVRREEILSGESKKYKPIINYYDYSGDFGNISHEGNATFRGGKKPIKMIKHFIEIANLDEGDIVLDFFSGSASTAHAVLNYKEQTGKKIKYIMVQVAENFPEDSDYNQHGFSTICDLAKTRLKNINNDYKNSLSELDSGFRVLKCDSSNMKEIYYNPAEYEPSLFSRLEDNIKEDRSPEDLLFQVMLDLGVLLSSKITETTIAGKTVFNVEDNYLIACFDDNVTEEVITKIAKHKPYYFVMRDSSMANDGVATNFEQIFATYSPETVRKVL